MAGFDAHFTFRAHDEVLVRALFRAVRRRARLLRVSIRSQVKVADEGYANISFSGHGFRLDMVLERLRRDLPTYAEAVEMPGRTPEQRRRLANGLVDVIGRYRAGLYDRYYRENEDYVPRLRALRRQPTLLALFDLFPRSHEDLWTRLEVTLDVLIAWSLDEVAPETALEELHTAFELLLTRAAGKTRAPAFVELVDLAVVRGWLGDHYAEASRHGYYWENPSDGLSERELLLALKDARKVAKHKGDAGAGPWLTKHFTASTALLERLSTRMP